MANPTITIKPIRLKELCDYARAFTGPAALMGIAPITRIRARSQVKNPSARPEDVALLAAVCGDRVVGTHGVMPGLLAQNGRFSRVHWSSAVYVAEEFRGRGVGRQLIEAFKSLGKDVVVPGGMTPSAEGAYRSGGFRPTGKLDYFQLRVERIDRSAHLIRTLAAHPSIAGHPLGSAVNWLGHQTATVQKKAFYRRANARMAATRGGLWRPVDRIHGFERLPSAKRAVFFRGTDTLNWMLANPWVYSLDAVTPDHLRDEVRHYYFTKTRALFRYAAFEFNAARNGSGSGFLILSLSRTRRRTTVRVLDHEAQGTGTARMACGLALAAAGGILADRIEFPPDLAAPFRNDPLLRRLIKRQSQTGVGFPGSSNSPLAHSMGKIDLSMCDGDSAFT